MTHDSLDSAYAVLGLGRDAPSIALKRRYRILVTQWHPDRFVGDAQGIADATTMLKAINRAYSTILEHRKRDFTLEPPCQSNRASATARRFDGHLTPQQVDDIVAAVRHSQSLLAVTWDDDIAGWWSRAASLTIVLLYAVAARTAGESPSVLVTSILPLTCIWFPTMFGERIGGRITKPSPPILVWFFGWVVLFLPVIAQGIIWLRER